jgi:hypothetical protein
MPRTSLGFAISLTVTERSMGLSKGDRARKARCNGTGSGKRVRPIGVRQPPLARDPSWYRPATNLPRREVKEEEAP